MTKTHFHNSTVLCLSFCLVCFVSLLQATEAKEETKAQKFVFEEHEAKFLTQLAGHKEQFNQMVVLFGLAESVNSPKNPEGLLRTLITAGITTRLPDIGDAVENMRIIVLVKTRDEVILFRMGKHPDFLKQPPSKTNYAYFKALEENLTKQINSRNAKK